MRFFLMTGVTLLLQRLLRLRREAAVWSEIILAAVFFGAGHLPATAQLTELTPLVLARAFSLNGLGGIAFGWLYWKKGLETAMGAHIVADVIIHGLLQLII